MGAPHTLLLPPVWLAIGVTVPKLFAAGSRLAHLIPSGNSTRTEIPFLIDGDAVLLKAEKPEDDLVERAELDATLDCT